MSTVCQILKEEPPIFLESDATSIVDVLKFRAKTNPDQDAYIHIDEDDKAERKLTFSQLDIEARKVAALLESKKAEGERILLLYPSGLEYIVAFMGCLYAKAIAVPIYPPRDNKNAARLKSIVKNSRPIAALASHKIYSRLQKSGAIEELENRTDDENESYVINEWIISDNIDIDPSQFADKTYEKNDIAFLQYTSGSTSDPKGVMVSHGNLIHNQKMLKAGFQLAQDTIIMTWLPLFHDMGLIGTILPAIYNGCSCYVMAPTDFLRRPIRWLKAISDYKVTYTGAPNFAYDLCVNRINLEDCKGLDLSSLRYLFNGAEPIKGSTLDNFSYKFSSLGFNSEIFFPCYGLAEATLFVSGTHLTKEPPRYFTKKPALVSDLHSSVDSQHIAQSFVNCGRLWLDEEVIIVNPDTHEPCPEGCEGEIWVMNDSVTLGYWQCEEATEAAFSAKLASNPSKKYLRSGDLGIMQSGYLYVTGRRKDVIIVRGQNHYPQDIEYTVEQACQNLSENASAAFSIEGEVTKLVVVSEVKRTERHRVDMTETMENAKKSISLNHNLELYELILIRPNTIMKTSSGKIQRSKMKELYVTDQLRVVSRSV